MKKRLPIILFSIFYLIFSLLTFKSYGLTNDEPEEYFLGKLLYIKLIANDPILEHDFVIDTGRSNLYKYNRIYQAILYSLNESESYEIYHLLNLIFALPIFIFSYELVLRIYKKPQLAILAPIFLFLTPRFMGHIPANPKDVPFAVSYFISLCLIILLKNHNRPFSIFLLGFSFGLTQSLRIIGLSIHFVYALFCLITYLHDSSAKKILSNKKISIAIEKFFFMLKDFKLNSEVVQNFVFRFLVIISLSFFVNMLTLPYLGADPLGNFINLVQSGNKFPWTGEVLFNSQIFTSGELPWNYLPVWILITTPLSFLGLLAFGITQYRNWNRAEFLFWLSLTINLVIFFTLNPIIYDGLRHMLFLIPFLTIITVFSLIRLIKKFKGKRKIIALTISINLLFVAMMSWKLFPYQYIYFNEIGGGVLSIKNAEGRFELDYWGASYKEAVQWLNKNITLAEDEQKIQVGICGDPAQFNYYADQTKFELVYQDDQADYLICHIRGGNSINNEIFTNKIYESGRAGVALIQIFSR